MAFIFLLQIFVGFSLLRLQVQGALVNLANLLRKIFLCFYTKFIFEIQIHYISIEEFHNIWVTSKIINTTNSKHLCDKQYLRCFEVENDFWLSTLQQQSRKRTSAECLPTNERHFWIISRPFLIWRMSSRYYFWFLYNAKMLIFQI